MPSDDDDVDAVDAIRECVGGLDVRQQVTVEN